MDSDDINSDFFKMVETSLADVSAEAIGQHAMTMLMRTIARTTELNTYLSRYSLSHMLGVEQNGLSDDVYLGLEEVVSMVEMIIDDLLNCTCPDCMCECDEMEDEDELCGSCVRFENCECDVDFTCEACLEYERNHPTD